MALKITLDEQAKAHVGEMLKELKGTNPEVSLSPSSLANWIIKYFVTKSFSQNLGKIADDHFNPKTYLRLQLKDLDSVEKVESALTQVRNKMKTAGGQCRRTREEKS